MEADTEQLASAPCHHYPPLPLKASSLQLSCALDENEKQHLYLKLRSLIQSAAWKYSSLTEGPPALQWWTWQLHCGGGAWANTVGLMRSLNCCCWDQVCITTNSNFNTCRHLCRLSLFELSEFTSLITSSKLSTCLLDVVPKSLLKEIWPLVNA